MNAAPAPNVGIKNILESTPCIPATGCAGDLNFSMPPKLDASDLEDPAKFHHRLAEWLMAQR